MNFKYLHLDREAWGNSKMAFYFNTKRYEGKNHLTFVSDNKLKRTTSRDVSIWNNNNNNNNKNKQKNNTDISNLDYVPQELGKPRSAGYCPFGL